MATATQEPRVGTESAEARIEQALAATGSLLRSRELSVGALWSGAALFAALAGLAIVHGVFRPSPLIGISTLILAGVASLVVLTRTFLRPLVTSINPYYAARTIEAAIPDCRNSVINWLDLRSQPMPLAIKGAVINRAARDIQDLDVAEAVYALPRSKVPVTLFTLSAVLLVVQAFLMGPGPFSHALGRGLTPWADHPVLANTQIEIVSPEGGDGSVAVGRDMAIKVKLTGKVPESGAPDAATLWVWNSPEQAPVAIPMNPGSDPAREPNVWIASVTKDLVQMGFWYRVTAGDNRTADHRVEVRLDLFIQSVTNRVEPPDYLRQDPVEGAESAITAIRGSKITITGLASGNLRSAEMSFYAGAERRLEKTKASLDPADPKRFTISTTATESGQYHLRIVNTAGDPFESPLAPITVNEDQKPVIKLVLPTTTPAKLRLVDTEVFKFQISDDFGLAGVSGHLALPDGKKVALAATGLPTLPGAKPVQATDGSWTVRAGELREHAGKLIKLVVSARDARPNDLGLVENETVIEILKNSTEVRLIQPAKEARLKPGQNLQVIADISGTIPEEGKPDSPRIVYTALGDNRGGQTLPLGRPVANQGRWTGQVPANLIGEGGWVQVLAGDGASPLQKVEIATPLKLNGVSVKVEPPAYIKAPPTVSKEREIKALAGSKAIITLETNVPGVTGGIFYKPEGGAEREIPGNPDIQNTRNLDVPLPLDKSGSYRVVIKGEGNTWRDMGTFPVEVVEDKPPTVELVEPVDGASVPINGQVLARIKAEDDWGLKSLTARLEWLVEGRETPLKAVQLPLKPGEAGQAKKHEGIYPVKLPDLRDEQGQPVPLAAGQKIRLKVEARDHHPDPARMGQSAAILLSLAPATNEEKKKQDEQRDKNKMDQFQQQQQQQQNNKNEGQPMQGGKPEQGMNQENKPNQNDKPMPGQGDKPMPGQGDKPMPGDMNQPMGGQNEKPMPGQEQNNMAPEIKDVEKRIQDALKEKPNDQPMPGQGDKPMPGQGDKPMPGQGDKPMPGQGDKPMPGQGDKPMPGQGDKPMPGQGDKPMPGQGDKPMPGQGDKPMPGQGDKPMPGQGDKPMPGQGDKPMPGQGDKPMPGQGDKPMPGQGDKPMPGQGDKPMPGQGDKPMPGQGDKPMPGQGDKPMPGQGDKPMPGQGDKPMPGQGDKPMPGQGDKPMPGQGDKPMPGQDDKPMPGQGDKPMPGQGDKPMPGQGDKPMPGQGDKPMPGQGDKPMPGQGDKPMPGQGDKPMPGQGDKPMPGQGDKPMPGQGDKPMPGQGDKPMPGQGDKPMPGQGDKPMPGQGDKPMPGQGDKPMPGQGDKPMPGQGDKPMPGNGDKPMPGQGDKPMPGNGDKPMPGQGDKPMPGNGDKPMPGQGDKPMPGQGDKPMPGQGDKPMPGQGDKPMPGNGDKPMPGQGDKPMPGNGDKPMPGQGDKPMPGQGDKPMPGQGDKPMPGQGDKPMPGQGNNDRATAPGMNPTAEDNREAISGSREKPDAVDPANAKAALTQLENLQDQIRKNKDKLKQKGISDEEIRKYEEYLRKRQNNLEKDMNRPDQAAPQQAGGLQSVGVRKARGGALEGGEAGSDNRPPPPAEYQDAWREFTRKRKLPADPKLR